MSKRKYESAAWIDLQTRLSIVKAKGPQNFGSLRAPKLFELPLLTVVS